MVPETVFKANRQVRVKCPSYTEVNDLRSSHSPFQSLKFLSLVQINAICKIFGLSDFLDVKVRLNVSIPQLNILTPTYLQFQYIIMFKDVYRETLTVYRSPPSQLSILIDYIRYFSIKPNIIISTISLQITRPSLYIGKDKYEKLLTQ